MDVASVTPRTDALRVAPRLKVFYFLYYLSVGVFHPFFTPYLRGLGLDGTAIGSAQMVGAVAAVPAALVWATIADRLGVATRALQLSTLGTFVAVAWLPWARTPGTITAVLAAQGLVAPAIVPLIDAVTVETLRRNPETSYARVRAFGSLGYVFAATLLGLALHARGDRAGDALVPAAYVAIILSFCFLATFLPAVPLTGRPPRLSDALSLLKDGRLLLVLLAGAVHSGTSAAYLLFGVLVHDLGLPATVTGLGMGLGVCAEVLVLFAFPWLERRFQVGTLLVISFAATALRWFFLSKTSGAAELVLLQLLHGLTFGVYWGASVSAMSRLVPPALRATGQALYSAVAFSVGGAIGYRLVGFGYDHMGGAGPVFLGASIAELGALALALALRALWK